MNSVAEQITAIKKKRHLLALGSAFLVTLAWAPCILGCIATPYIMAIDKGGGINTDWLPYPIGGLTVWVLFLILSVIFNPTSNFSRIFSTLVTLAPMALFIFCIYDQYDEISQRDIFLYVGLVLAGGGNLWILHLLHRLQKVESALETQVNPTDLKLEEEEEAEEEAEESDGVDVQPGWDEAPPADPPPDPPGTNAPR